MIDLEKGQPSSPPLAPKDDATLPLPCCHCSWTLPSPVVAFRGGPRRQFIQRDDDDHQDEDDHDHDDYHDQDDGCRQHCRDFCRRRRFWRIADGLNDVAMLLLLGTLAMAMCLLSQDMDSVFWIPRNNDNIVIAVPVKLWSLHDSLHGTHASDKMGIVVAVEGLGESEDALASVEEATGNAVPDEMLRRRGEDVEAEAETAIAADISMGVVPTSLLKRSKVDDTTTTTTTITVDRPPWWTTPRGMITLLTESIGPAGVPAAAADDNYDEIRSWTTMITKTRESTMSVVHHSQVTNGPVEIPDHPEITNIEEEELTGSTRDKKPKPPFPGLPIPVPVPGLPSSHPTVFPRPTVLPDPTVVPVPSGIPLPTNLPAVPDLPMPKLPKIPLPKLPLPTEVLLHPTDLPTVIPGFPIPIPPRPKVPTFFHLPAKLVQILQIVTDSLAASPVIPDESRDILTLMGDIMTRIGGILPPSSLPLPNYPVPLPGVPTGIPTGVPPVIPTDIPTGVPFPPGLLTGGPPLPTRTRRRGRKTRTYRKKPHKTHKVEGATTTPAATTAQMPKAAAGIAEAKAKKGLLTGKKRADFLAVARAEIAAEVRSQQDPDYPLEDAVNPESCMMVFELVLTHLENWLAKSPREQEELREEYDGGDGGDGVVSQYKILDELNSFKEDK